MSRPRRHVSRVVNPFTKPWHPSMAHHVRKAYRMGLAAGRREKAATMQASEDRWVNRHDGTELVEYLDDWRDGYLDGAHRRSCDVG